MSIDKFNFTVKSINSIACGPSKKRYQDTQVRGLALRVTPAGAKTFVYYRRLQSDNESPNKLVEMKIGDVSDTSIEQARKQATALNAIVGRLTDPSKPLKKPLTYGDVFNKYIELYAKLETSTWRAAVYNHGKYFT